MESIAAAVLDSIVVIIRFIARCTITTSLKIKGWFEILAQMVFESNR